MLVGMTRRRGEDSTVVVLGGGGGGGEDAQTEDRLGKGHCCWLTTVTSRGTR